MANFDHLDVRKNFIEINVARSPRDIHICSREYVEEPKLNQFLKYTESNFYSIQVVDLRFHNENIYPIKFQLFEENGVAATIARLFVLLKNISK